ncbi:hypothetical protein LA76x_0116 [Lysobacter antibioticus]|uniref:Uncharacterized protein n=1 Tax=Lysobacter antibioticus TaxID=84531 RepID=A0A0S2F431_LYSAN|nr:hypothetical protein LA76x_0116 [Lysobacter antibioticus]
MAQAVATTPVPTPSRCNSGTTERAKLRPLCRGGKRLCRFNVAVLAAAPGDLLLRAT